MEGSIAFKGTPKKKIQYLNLEMCKNITTKKDFAPSQQSMQCDYLLGAVELNNFWFTIVISKNERKHWLFHANEKIPNATTVLPRNQLS
jgi:hypothetical protein